MAKKTKDEKFWWIFNQEEIPVAVSYAQSQGGALAKFEKSTGLSREGYRAEEMKFKSMCSWTGIR